MITIIAELPTFFGKNRTGRMKTGHSEQQGHRNRVTRQEEKTTPLHLVEVLSTSAPTHGAIAVSSD